MSRKNIKLLIAEDEKMFADMLKMVLTQNGYVPDVAYRGDDAIRMVEAKNYDIVLTDIRMPGATGLDLLKVVKECDIDTQVVVISAYGDAGNILEALRLGASDFIQKPIEMPELIPSLIEKIYERRKLRVENRELLSHLSKRTKELEEALQTIRTQQEKIVQNEKFRVIGTMASGLALEINNPLAAISSSVEQVDGVIKKVGENLSSLKLDAYDQRNVESVMKNASETIKSGVTRVSQITMALRAFSRIEKSSGEEVLVNDAVKDALGLLSPAMKGVELNLELADEQLPVKVSRQNLTHAILNFLQNSCAAMEGGKDKKLSIKSVVQNGEQLLLISDTGSGLEAGVKSKLREPYFSSKPLGRGAGIGLPIAFGIIEGSGGNIEIESERGKGTTIRVLWKVA